MLQAQFMQNQRNRLEAAKMVREVDDILEQCKAEGRAPTKAETDRMDELVAACDDLPQNLPAVFPLAAEQNRGMRFRTSDGSNVRSLHHTERLIERVSPQDSCRFDLPSVGDVVHGLLTGDVRSEVRAAIESTDSNGGYLLNPVLSTQMIDLARSASVTMRAGAQTLPINGETSIVRVLSDPTSHWRHETVKVTSSDVTFGRLTLKPKVLACIIPISIELLEDSANAASIIEGIISSSMALKLDQAVLVGSGDGAEPLGVANTSGVGVAQSSVGTPDDYAELTTAVKNILVANYPGDISSLSWLSHPTNFATYDALADTTGQPLEATRWAAQLQKLSTTSLSTGTMIVGDFTQVLVGMRAGLMIRVLDSGNVLDANGDEINAASQLMKLIVCHMRADVAVMRPSWFDVLTGVTS
jgi:HK97 family phage major capsid protein